MVRLRRGNQDRLVEAIASLISVKVKSDRLILANLATESSYEGENLIAMIGSFLLQIF